MSQTQKKKKIYLTLERNKGQIKLRVKVPAEMEEFFSELSENKSQASTRWLDAIGEGVKFYTLTEEYQALEQKLTLSSIFNDFGESLLRDRDRINLAPLRVVGASKGITITCKKFTAITNLDFEYYIKELGRAAKQLWENCIAKQRINAVLTFEF